MLKRLPIHIGPMAYLLVEAPSQFLWVDYGLQHVKINRKGKFGDE